MPKGQRKPGDWGGFFFFGEGKKKKRGAEKQD